MVHSSIIEKGRLYMWGDNQMNQIILNHKIKTIQKPYQIIVEEENKKVDI